MESYKVAKKRTLCNSLHPSAQISSSELKCNSMTNYAQTNKQT